MSTPIVGRSIAMDERAHRLIVCGQPRTSITCQRFWLRADELALDDPVRPSGDLLGVRRSVPKLLAALEWKRLQVERARDGSARLAEGSQERARVDELAIIRVSLTFPDQTYLFVGDHHGFGRVANPHGDVRALLQLGLAIQRDPTIHDTG